MSSKSIDERIASKLEAQQKLSEEIAQLKREQAKKDKAEREKTERQLGRLAMACGLGEFALDELKGIFQKAKGECLNRHDNGRRSSQRLNSEDKLV